MRDYTVILSITGRGDQLHLTMRSDPPLPELEIVSLISGGRTRDEYAARSTTAACQKLAAQCKRTALSERRRFILSDLLQQRAGGRFLSMAGVRIDPFLVGAATNREPESHFPEQVAKDLSITYSQEIFFGPAADVSHRGTSSTGTPPSSHPATSWVTSDSTCASGRRRLCVFVSNPARRCNRSRPQRLTWQARCFDGGAGGAGPALKNSP